tara:strand:- start:77 stop:370 length:294 start_codon:yes stop_codon:yes gene_type:complete
MTGGNKIQSFPDFQCHSAFANALQNKTKPARANSGYLFNRFEKKLPKSKKGYHHIRAPSEQETVSKEYTFVPYKKIITPSKFTLRRSSTPLFAALTL